MKTACGHCNLEMRPCYMHSRCNNVRSMPARPGSFKTRKTRPDETRLEEEGNLIISAPLHVRHRTLTRPKSLSGVARISLVEIGCSHSSPAAANDIRDDNNILSLVVTSSIVHRPSPHISWFLQIPTDGASPRGLDLQDTVASLLR